MSKKLRTTSIINNYAGLKTTQRKKQKTKAKPKTVVFDTKNDHEKELVREVIKSSYVHFGQERTEKMLLDLHKKNTRLADVLLTIEKRDKCGRYADPMPDITFDKPKTRGGK